MNAIDLTLWSVKHDADKKMIDWQAGKDLDEFWETCPNGQWMEWVIDKMFLDKAISLDDYTAILGAAGRITCRKCSSCVDLISDEHCSKKYADALRTLTDLIPWRDE